MLKNATGIILGLAMLTGELAGCQSLVEQNDVTSLPETEITNSQLATSTSTTSLEQAIYQQINQYRLSRNLPALKLNAYISQYARIHSEQMASGKVSFSHDGFEARIKAIGQKILYQKAAENLAVNQGYADPAKVAVQGWIKSSGHRQNMEGEFDLTGIGVARNGAGDYYFTQIFLKQRSSASSNLNTNTVSPFDSPLPITLEQEVHRQVNQYRISRNLAPLRLDAQMSYEARLYSQKMAQGKASFSHKGIEQRFKKVSQIIPYRKAAENLALNKGYSDPVTVAVQGWIKSPGHRQNMEGKFNITGIGIAKNVEGEYYFTQFFVQER
jgi:uncharacterized protein YkwD